MFPPQEELDQAHISSALDNLLGVVRLDAPFGTAENPVEVTSEFDNRVVGVPDPDDDSLVWWGIIEEGSPPKQVSALLGKFCWPKRCECRASFDEKQDAYDALLFRYHAMGHLDFHWFVVRADNRGRGVLRAEAPAFLWWASLVVSSSSWTPGCGRIKL